MTSEGTNLAAHIMNWLGIIIVLGLVLISFNRCNESYAKTKLNDLGYVQPCPTCDWEPKKK